MDVESEGERAPGQGRIRISSTELDLRTRGNGASRLSLEFSIPDTRSEPVRVEVRRVGEVWNVTQVRHGG